MSKDKSLVTAYHKKHCSKFSTATGIMQYNKYESKSTHQCVSGKEWCLGLCFSKGHALVSLESPDLKPSIECTN